MLELLQQIDQFEYAESKEEIEQQYDNYLDKADPALIKQMIKSLFKNYVEHEGDTIH